MLHLPKVLKLAKGMWFLLWLWLSQWAGTGSLCSPPVQQAAPQAVAKAIGPIDILSVCLYRCVNYGFHIRIVKGLNIFLNRRSWSDGSRIMEQKYAIPALR